MRFNVGDTVYLNSTVFKGLTDAYNIPLEVVEIYTNTVLLKTPRGNQVFDIHVVETKSERRGKRIKSIK